MLEGNALDVLKKARDYVHRGWRLAASPLYGNFKPNQQPYRTILLYKTRENDLSLDFESLSLIENAIRVYEDSPVLQAPGDLPDDTDKDFRYLDFHLMRETLDACGVLAGEVARTAGTQTPSGALSTAGQ